MSDPFHLLPAFESLAAAGYAVTSPADAAYNCIAWAAGDTQNWWWPDEDGYWPDAAPREWTYEAFVAAFATLGFAPCADALPEPNVEKVAVYGGRDGPLHAARQLADGAWTSKLGAWEDITHVSVDGVVGREYGRVVVLLKRATTPAA